MDKRPALGKGLSALIPDAPPASAGAPTELDIDRLSPSDYQPRTHIDDARLEELANSIRANGVIQPIIVRRSGDTYRIVAGERRWRAARRAGLARVPVVVRESGDGDAPRNLLEIALIENIQREDLNPIEEALAYRRLVDEFGLTQDAVSTAVGKDRATVANTLRLLKLPAEIQNDVAAGALTMGHARALLALPGEAAQLPLARDIKTRGLSVRETESLVRQALGNAESPAKPTRARTARGEPDVHTRDAEDRLKVRLGTRVRIVRKGKGGRIEIDFVSEEELIRVFELLMEG
jgi:ParB family transcriptional regulator, chromosome partitioning protein